MFPGGRGNLNSRKMQQMMKQMGISMDEIGDVEEVQIKTKEKDLVFKEVEVTKMDAQGKTIYQVVGEPEEFEKELEPDKEDIELVMDQANATEEEAKEALIEQEGDIADAIVELRE